MAQVPEDVKTGLQALSKAKNVPINDLLARLKKIIDEDENLKAMDNATFKVRVAWAALYKEYSAAQGQECLITPLLHATPRFIRIKNENTAVCEVTALVKPLKNTKGEEISYNSPEEGWQYASGTLWRDAAKNAEILEVGKVYNTKIPISNTYGEKGKKKEREWGLGLFGSSVVFKATTIKAPDFKKYYEENISPSKELMNLIDADVNESAHETDIRIARIQIMDEDVGEREDGSVYAYYDVMDNSIAGETRRLFIDKRDYKYMQGSVLLAGVTVRNTAKKDQEPIFRLNPQWFIPEIAEEVSIEDKTTTDTEEIILDDEPEGEKKVESEVEEEEKSEKEEGNLFEI